MNKYTIYCTSEQVKKALELGAQIEYVDRFNENLPSELIEFTDANGKIKSAEFVIPTAEQMIGWLEEQGDINAIEVGCAYKWGYRIFNKEYWEIMKHNTIYQSRQEATLAAIDAALEYLVDNGFIK